MTLLQIVDKLIAVFGFSLKFFSLPQINAPTKIGVDITKFYFCSSINFLKLSFVLLSY